MKKIIALLMVSIIVLVGCSSDKVDSLDGMTIKIATNALNEDNPTGDEAIEAADQRREDKASIQEKFVSDTGVSLEFMELAEEDELETITQSVLAGDPVADVVRVSSNVYAELVASDMLTDIGEYSTKYLKDGEIPNSWAVDAGQVFDNYYGISRDLAPSPEMLVYDLNLLEKAGMDKTPLDMYKEDNWTWESSREYFLNVQAAIGEDYTVWAAEPYFVAKYGMASNGVVPISPDGTVNLTSPEAYEALDFYKGLYDDGIMKFYLDETSNPIWAASQAEWENGAAVFTTLEGWRSDCCIRNSDKEYGFVPYPTNKGIDASKVSIAAGTGDMYVVPKGVKDPAAAAQVAFYLNRQANTEFYVEGLDVTAAANAWMNTNSSEEDNGTSYAALKINAVPDVSKIFMANTDFSVTGSATRYFVDGESISAAFESGTKLIEQNIEALKAKNEEKAE